MKFEDFKYTRPNLESYKERVNIQLDLISTDEIFDVEFSAINAVFDLQDEMATLIDLVAIRNTVDTTDEFYEKEQEFFDESMPHLQQLEQEFMKKLLESNYRKELEEKYGTLILIPAPIP